MKSAVISVIILAVLFILVSINTAVVDGMITDTMAHVDALEPGDSIKEDFTELQDKYERRAKFINLTVSHVMMSEVEEAFAEIEGAIAAEDEGEIIQAKSRLSDALGQLKRLAGLSLDSII